MARDLDELVRDFRERPLDEGPYTFVAADALMMKVREGGLPATSTLGEIAHLARAMKAPRIRDSAAALADRARAEGSTHEQYLARVLEEEVLAGETSGSGSESKPPASRRSKPWTISTSPTNAQCANKWCCTWPSWTSSSKPRT